MAPSTSGSGGDLRDDGGLAHPPGHVQRLVDYPPQLVQAERLEQVVVGAVLHRLDGGVGALGHRDEDDRDARVDAADLLVDLQAGLVGQAKIEQNHVGRIGADALQPRGPRAGNLDPVLGRRERLAHLLLDQGWVVIDEQQMGHGWLDPTMSRGEADTSHAYCQDGGTACPAKRNGMERQPDDSASRLALVSHSLPDSQQSRATSLTKP